MSSIWLVCASAGRYARVRAEIDRRDACARLMRFSDPEGVPAAAEVLNRSAAGIAISLEDLGGVESLVCGLAACGWKNTVLVVADAAEGAQVARLLEAGATEVIAAGSTVPDAGASEACAQGEPTEPVSTALPADDHEPVRESPGEDEAPPYSDEDVPEWEEERYACIEDAPPWDEPVSEAGGAPEVAPVEDAARAGGTRAPLVVTIAGRGGTGKTTLVATMAHAAAAMGLRAAVLDLDLMFGNLHEVMGAQEPLDLSALCDAAPGEETMLAVEKSAMRIAPGVTLWGPSLLPERAELLSAPVDKLIEILRGEADVVFADTSTFWSDSVASAVSQCDRCLVVGQAQGAASAVRAVELAGRLGVAKTKMTSVFNRFGAPGNMEEQAMRFEMAVALRSRVRVADGGDALSQMAAFGRMGEYVATESPFVNDIQAFACSMLKELGCDVSEWERAREQREERSHGRPRVQLPWKRLAGAKK